MAAPSGNELLVLSKFRDAILDVELKPEEKTDMALLCWLRARDLNIEKASEMLRKSVIWKKEMDFDNLLTWKAPDSFKNLFPYEICGEGKTGCPVLVMGFGRWNIKKAVEVGLREPFLRYVDQMIARCSEMMKRTNLKKGPDDIPITQMILICDYQGFSMRQFASIMALQTNLEFIRRFEMNYPEILKTVVLTNAPRAITMILAILRPMMSGNTSSKMQYFGSNQNAMCTAVLLKEVAKDQLPVFLGGTKNTCEFLAKDFKQQQEEIELTEIQPISTTITAGQALTLEYKITRLPTIISWTFEIPEHNIGFSIRHKETDDEVLPRKLYDSYLGVSREGSLACERTGSYSIIFDNAFSKLEKTIRYNVTLQEPRLPVELMH